MKIDPIHQFNIEPLFTIGHIGNQTIAFTNSSLYMFLSVAVISLLMIGGMAGRQLVPGRLQSIAEISYEFVAQTLRSTPITSPVPAISGNHSRSSSSGLVTMRSMSCIIAKPSA